MRNALKAIAVALLGIESIAGAAHDAGAQVSFTGVYTQNFNTLPHTGAVTWTDNGTLSGWYVAKRTVSNNTIVVPAYSYAVGGSTSIYADGSGSDWALGEGNKTSNVAMYMGVLLTNTTGSTIDSITVSYSGEQWYQGLAAGAISTSLNFEYSTTATTIYDYSGAYTAVSALNFTSPVLTSTTAAGSMSVQSTEISATFTISGGWAAGSSLWLRWVDPYQSVTTDNDLAIDDLTISGVAVPEPSTWLLGVAGLVLCGGGAAFGRRGPDAGEGSRLF